jgi:hypothetical protein
MVAFLDLNLLWRAIEMARADVRVVTNATIAGVVGDDNVFKFVINKE